MSVVSLLLKGNYEDQCFNLLDSLVELSSFSHIVKETGCGAKIMSAAESLHHISLELKREIDILPRIHRLIEPTDYVELVWVYRRNDTYGKLGPDLERRHAELRQQSPRLSFLFNKFLVCSLIDNFAITQSPYNIPRSIEQLYLKELRRIKHQLSTFDLSFYDLGRDDFLKDLAILTHRLIPLGAEFAEPDCGVPRSVLFRSGLTQLLRGLWFFGIRLRGFKPLFSLHVHNLVLDEFNPDGLNQTYRRMAELLELNPEFKGWFSASWFLDPQLASISPHLTHLRKVPQDNGAAVFFVTADPQGMSGALTKSRKRQRLFREGEYLPRVYMRVWPRQAMLDWYRRTSVHVEVE